MGNIKRFVSLALLGAGLCLPLTAASVAQDATNRSKAMMVLDASGSMWGEINGVPKISIARKVVDDVLAKWDPTVDVGLMAYGHRRKGDCSDIEIVQPIAPLNASRFSDVVRRLQPNGKTPISASLFEAAKALRHIEDPASVILVSDGLETCEADPCVMATQLNNSGIDFTVHVVGFGLSREESQKLQCVADNTGGKFLNADNAAELTTALAKTADLVREKAAQKPAQDTTRKVALEISKLDLQNLSFDVQEFRVDKTLGKTFAKGTSNGVGWTVIANDIYRPFTNMQGGARFNDLPGNYDDLHVGSDFTIVFDRQVTSMLVVLANDNDTGDGPNFQELAPRDFVDANNPNGGTQVRIEDKGGALFYYYDINITTLTHVNDNGINDGWDLAFFVFPVAN
ncbi:MAG: VWA domain-containing protein [Pseudomonadota bacterium]